MGFPSCTVAGSAVACPAKPQTVAPKCQAPRRPHRQFTNCSRQKRLKVCRGLLGPVGGLAAHTTSSPPTNSKLRSSPGSAARGARRGCRVPPQRGWRGSTLRPRLDRRWRVNAFHQHRRHLQPIHSMLPNQLHPPGHRAETATSATAARAMREPAAGTVVEPPPVVGCVGQQ